MSRTLLLSTLLEKDACEQQVMLFRKKFGESVKRPRSRKHSDRKTHV